VPERAWGMVFLTFQFFLKNKENNCFIVDSFPVKTSIASKSFQSGSIANKRFL
jgi:hypothetical protein